ncbi:MAG: spore coat protein CotJB [Oscillospiraceae bacterium]|nr:spore coat protein CotJB [Oscillospiraceae bacterium]
MNADNLIKAIQMYDFYLLDLHLYLDTHPNDREALELFRQYNALRSEAGRVYTERFGPLTAADAASGERFTWVDAPWPWERSAG